MSERCELVWWVGGEMDVCEGISQNYRFFE